MCSRTEVNEENVLRWATISGLNTQYCGADIKKVAQSLVKSGQLITRKRGRYTVFSAPNNAPTGPAATAPIMTTEITTEITTESTHQIQTLARGTVRWINWGSTIADKEQADRTLRLVRDNYPEAPARLLLVTTTTEVIA